MLEEFLFAQKYRPKKVADCILPPDLKKVFQEFVDSGNVPNLILAGTSGVGKTTVAMAMVEELGSDYIVINGSLDRNIDTLRDKVATFASSMSFTGGRKYVIIDEADGLAPTVQPALRGFMEEFSHNAGFIFTVNNVSKMIPAIHSRSKVIDFRIKKGDMVSLASGFMKRLEVILKTEGIEYDKKAIAGLIQNHFPDWRRILNEVQWYGASGRIDSGILANADSTQVDALVEHMKRKEFSKVRVWVAENADVPCQTLFRAFYDRASTLFSPNSIPEVVITLNKYGYQSAFVSDVEINTAACFAEIMLVAEFK